MTNSTETQEKITALEARVSKLEKDMKNTLGVALFAAFFLALCLFQVRHYRRGLTRFKAKLLFLLIFGHRTSLRLALHRHFEQPSLQGYRILQVSNYQLRFYTYTGCTYIGLHFCTPKLHFCTPKLQFSTPSSCVTQVLFTSLFLCLCRRIKYYLSVSAVYRYPTAVYRYLINLVFHSFY